MIWTDFFIEIFLVYFLGSLPFFIGYKLRNFIPQNRRFTVGFFGMVVIDSLFLAYVMFNERPSHILSIGMAIGLAFSLGIGIGNSPKDSNKPPT